MRATYDNPQRRTYQLSAAALASAAVIGRIQGPAGLQGQVVGFEYRISTGVTTAAAVVDVDTNAGLTTPFSATIEVAAANTGGAATAAELDAGLSLDARLPADTIVEISSDGGPAAGAADLYITIDWF